MFNDCLSEKSKQWLKKYYPVPAERVSRRNALNHTLQKWKGLQREILQKHNLRTDHLCVVEKQYPSNTLLNVSGVTCALCKLSHTCNLCPIYIVFPEQRCVVAFQRFAENGNAELMLNILRTTKRKIALLAKRGNKTAMKWCSDIDTNKKHANTKKCT